MTYPGDRLREEMAFLAYHFHWPLQEILDLEHGERRRWCQEISRIHQRSSAEEET